MALETSIKLTYSDLEKALQIAQELESFLKGLEKGHNLKINSSGLSSVTRDLSKVEQMASRAESSFGRLGGVMKTVGGSMQNLGNVFGGKMINTVKTMATAFGTMGLYSSAQGTIQRYDTMRIFPKMMQHLGYGADEARAAIVKLEDAVIGLPTGLDEIVESARQLIPLTGDLNRGVNLAIAANNAFLAGGSDAQSVRYGQRQIKDLLAKGTLRSQEWDSLFTALGSGLGVIAEEMGYSSKANKGLSTVNDDLKYAESRLKSLRNTQKRLQKEGGTAKAIEKNTKAIQTWEAEYQKLLGQQDKSLGSFRNALKTNQIGALDFLEALEKVGTGEGELAKRADDYKDTISAAARNIKNALQKMGAAGLEALDNVLTEKTGKGIPGTIREVSDAIKQNLIPALEGWVSDHSNDIIAFFDRLKNYDWGDLISRIGNGLAKYYDIMTTFFTKMNPKFIAFMSVWGGPVGRMLSTAGGGITALGGIAGTLIRHFGLGSKGKAVTAAATAAADTAGAIGRIGFNFKSAFKGLGLAAGITGEVALIGGVIAEYAKIFEMISNLKMGDNFDKNIKAVGEFAGRAAVIATGITTIFGALSTIPGFAGFAATGELLSAGLIGLIGEIGGVFAQYVKVIDDIANMDVPSESRLKDIGKTVKALNTDLLGNVQKVPDNKVRSLENMAEMVEYTADIAAAMKKVKDVGQIGDMSQRISKLIKGTDEILRSGYGKTAKKKSKTVKNTMKNLADATESFASISTTLVGMRKNVDALTKGGQATVIDNLSSRMDAILGKVGDAMHQMEFRSAEYEKATKNIGTISKGVESVATIASTLVQARKNISSLVSKRHNGTYKTDIGEQLTGLVGSMLPVIAKFQWKTKEHERAVDNIERFSSVAESMATIATSLVDARKNISSIIGKDDHGHYSANQDDLIMKTQGMLNSMNVISGIISKMDIDTSGDAEDKMTALKGVIGGLPEIITSLQSIQKPISDLGVEGDKWQMGDNLKGIINGLKSAFDGLSSADYTDLAANAQSLQQAVSQLSSIMSSLKAVQTQIGSLGIEGGKWAAGDQLGIAIRTITGMFGTEAFAGVNAGNLLTGVATNLASIVSQLAALASNASSAAKGLESASKGLDKLGKSASNHKGAIQDAATAAGKLKSGVTGIGGQATLAAAGITILGTSASNQVGNLSAAAGAASALAAAINSIPTSKTVNVTVSKSIAAGGSGIGWARQNIEGFASGGAVHGRGGIDNIRSWLTNGEFVMRKSAHQAFGTAFMNRINNLDVEGALKALSIRAGVGVGRRATVTNNYTRDNHANVTFNVNKATQGYSQRRASRWARALS